MPGDATVDPNKPNSGTTNNPTNTAGTQLTKSVRNKLGNLASRADELVTDVIRSRGGSGSNVQKIGEWAQRTMKEAAEAAVKGDAGAEAAIKMAKQAATKGQRY